MPRVRWLKPSFFSNDVLAEVHPLGRLLFAGLWGLADREGRLEDRPTRIKVEVLPYDKANVDKLLNELAARGFVTRYEVAGERYIQVNNFVKHQQPHHKEVASIIPAPPMLGSSMTQACVDHESSLHADPVTDPDPVTETDPVTRDPVSIRLSDEQESRRRYLHAQVRDRIFKGATAPDIDYGEDLIRRGATETDVDYAIQQAVTRNVNGRGAFGYVRSCLETRVKEREAGNDPDAVPEREAGAAARGAHVSGVQQGRLAGNRGRPREAADDFDDLPPHAIRADGGALRGSGSSAGVPGEAARDRITPFPGRDRASEGAR